MLNNKGLFHFWQSQLLDTKLDALNSASNEEVHEAAEVQVNFKEIKLLTKLQNQNM